jgi:hypothetical protein
MASVESGTGQLRANANGAPSGSDPWAQDKDLTTTPAEFSYTWTQSSGNLFLDTGNTPVGGVITITGIKVTSSSGGSSGGGDPGSGGGGNVVWQPAITASTTMNGGGEYVGDTGIKRDAQSSELTLAAIANGFTVTVVNGPYKPFCIQIPNAGGTKYYTDNGFTACTAGKTYTITFMASVTSGSGQLRAVENMTEGNNGPSGTWPKEQALTVSPIAFSYTWTQSSGNLKFDTGDTANGGVIKITDIKVTSP